MSWFKVYNDDCFNVFDKLSTKIDMVLCDLPYGTTKNSWDIILPFDKMWNCINSVCKESAAILLFGNQPFTSHLVLSNEKYFRYSLVWEKNKFSDFLNAKRKPMKTNEDICVFYKKQPTYNPQYSYGEPYKRWNTQEAVDKQSNYGSHKQNISQSDGKRLPTTVLHFNRIERPQHPTQKPVDMLEYIIKMYSNENDTILDFTMGSGSTGVACGRTNRNFIGIEKDENYFQIAEERIKESYHNLDNFS